jgi:hypothetical protein
MTAHPPRYPLARASLTKNELLCFAINRQSVMECDPRRSRKGPGIALSVVAELEPDGEALVIDTQRGIGSESRRKRQQGDYKTAGCMVHDDELW